MSQQEHQHARRHAQLQQQIASAGEIQMGMQMQGPSTGGSGVVGNEVMMGGGRQVGSMAGGAGNLQRRVIMQQQPAPVIQQQPQMVSTSCY